MLKSFDEVKEFYKRMPDKEREIFDKFFQEYAGMNIIQYTKLCKENSDKEVLAWQKTGESLQKIAEDTYKISSSSSSLYELANTTQKNVQQLRKTIESNKNSKILLNYNPNKLNS